ncbi:hypothetical protein PRZ48_011875 [Zasmidium cellare]|uniref:Uncharacterized protein n=1 Tax=Zasmidium cellare TaxID=395010 RepID=A0ABR0E7N4_ZASCE|nr:hypothetical protein PRZ48_011875 [Zasmidium cellare]
MAKEANIDIRLSLSSNIYRRSAPLDQKPSLSVTATLSTPALATFELIGEFDSGTILEEGFRVEHFDFFDLTTGQPVININPFPGTCDPHADLYLRSVVELHTSEPHVTSHVLEDVSPLSDPVRQLEIGHEYRIKLKPQRILCYDRSIADLFEDKDITPRDELLPTAIEVVLASDDELILKVEE